MLKVGQQEAEDGRAEQQPGDQLSHHGRLAHAQHGFAEQPADDHQRQNLPDENCFGRTLVAFPGGKGRARHQCQENKQQDERLGQPARA